MWEVDPMRYWCLAVFCGDVLVRGCLETWFLAISVGNDNGRVKVAAVVKVIGQA